ncbi:MAG: SAM-dependent methyltransferase [Bacteroidales bacterium]
MNGTLYLIPTTLGESCIIDVLPQHTANIAKNITYFVVENIRSARRFLKQIDKTINIDLLNFTELNEHTPESAINAMLSPLLTGHNVGVLSEAGVPAVADPGSLLVKVAHQNAIKVVPLVGPSSILLALMASGFNGQSFCFSGYIAVKQEERIKQIKHLEIQAKQQTQIFMETPYRNNKLMSDLLINCHPHTQVCIAADITLATEMIITRSVSEWKTKSIDLNKRPCIFLLQR